MDESTRENLHAINEMVRGMRTMIEEKLSFVFAADDLGLFAADPNGQLKLSLDEIADEFEGIAKTYRRASAHIDGLREQVKQRQRARCLKRD
ncbi:MAG TPA: hypothetical protein VGG19_01380 [Tepidisphaeraceae bacterium]|jgi:hypothetical protein